MMGFWKFSSFLALGFLVLYQMGILQAAPFQMVTEKKRCQLPTCVANDLAHFLSSHEGVLDPDFVPTDVGPNSYGRRRRDLQMSS